ncbi:hypothetical protein AB0F81_41845 [Actinoplanes sp. NPDC024001]|uniref:hypothetical protein n=1 Tax=Actinoplanes sp. NPDC024001 TaxID=3154598 RepID=UPI0033EC3E66
MIFDDTTIVCGVLVATDQGMVFAGPDGIAFEIPADDLVMNWAKMGFGCWLTSASSTYLVYLAPPTDGSPRLTRDAVQRIAGWLTTAGDLATLTDAVTDLGSAADAFGLGGVLGNSIKTVSSVAALRRARLSRRALQQRFAAA